MAVDEDDLFFFTIARIGHHLRTIDLHLQQLSVDLRDERVGVRGSRCGWVGEGGDRRDPAVNHRNRAEFSRVMGLPRGERDTFLESGKEAGRYGADNRSVLHNAHKGEVPHQPFFGLIVVSCDHAALRQSSDGLYVYGKNGREELPVARGLGGRAAELRELSDAILHGVKPFHDGAWGLATLEVCFAILESARTGKEIEMSLQVAC